jgi:hypothetical protein
MRAKLLFVAIALLLFSFFVLEASGTCPITECDNCANGICTQCAATKFLISPTACGSACVAGQTSVGTAGDGTDYCTCDNKKWRMDSGCVDYCPIETYVAQGTNQDGTGYCVTCESKKSNCKACNEYGTVCLECKTQYLLVDNACTQCSSGCDSCFSVAGGTKCSTCSTGKFLKPDGTCATGCTAETEYKEGTQCKSCGTVTTDCEKCAANSSGEIECRLCGNSKWLKLVDGNPACVASCTTDTEFQEAFTGKTVGRCVSCSTKWPNCKTCALNGASCSTCNDGYMLKPDGLCHACTLTSCLTCEWVTTGGGAEKCTKCSDGNYLQESSKTCKSTCLATEFQETVSEVAWCRDCTAVTAGCTQCNRPVPLQAMVCTACGTTKRLDDSASPKTCVSSCSGTQYESGVLASETGKCLPCTNIKSNCNACTEALGCSHCASSYFFKSDTQDCHQPCPSGFFNDNTDPANPVCSTCGSKITSCLNCNNDGTTCTSCSPGTISKNSGASCTACTITDCATCAYNGGTETCTKCTSKLIKLDSTACVTSCAATEYSSGVTTSGTEKCKTCVSLITGCSECTAVNGSPCTKCLANFWLRVSTGLCVSSCQVNTEYQEGSNTDGTGKCKVCNSGIANCNTCSGTGASLVCNTCAVGFVSKDAGKSCVPCSISGCAECSFTTSETCLRCTLPKILSLSNTCVEACTDKVNWVQDVTVNTAAAKKCRLCTENSVTNCIECSSQSVCTACKSSYYLAGPGTCTLCSTPISNCLQCAMQEGGPKCSLCPETYRLDTKTNSCIKCPVGCKSCDETNCLSCIVDTANPLYILVPTRSKCETCKAQGNTNAVVQTTVANAQVSACSYRPTIPEEVTSIADSHVEANRLNFLEISGLCVDPLDASASGSSKIYWVAALNGTDLSNDNSDLIKTQVNESNPFTLPNYTDPAGRLYGFGKNNKINVTLRVGATQNLTWYCENQYGLASVFGGSLLVDGPKKPKEAATLIMRIQSNTSTIDRNDFLCQVEKALGLEGRSLVRDDKGRKKI